MLASASVGVGIVFAREADEFKSQAKPAAATAILTPSLVRKPNE